MNRERAGDEATKVGRRTKAQRFAEAAELVEQYFEDDVATDVYVSLCVLAGVAAADAVCCARLGKYSVGQDHQQAVALLKSVDGDLAKSLSRLLGMKTKAQYGAETVGVGDCKIAGRAMRKLVEAARRA